MDLEKLTVTEIRNQDLSAMKETEEQLREGISTARMQVALRKEGASVSKVKKLKQGLARLLTIKTEKSMQVVKGQES